MVHLLDKLSEKLLLHQYYYHEKKNSENRTSKEYKFIPDIDAVPPQSMVFSSS